jgi:hypothetical protein
MTPTTRRPRGSSAKDSRLALADVAHGQLRDGAFADRRFRAVTGLDDARGARQPFRRIDHRSDREAVLVATEPFDDDDLLRAAKRRSLVNHRGG